MDARDLIVDLHVHSHYSRATSRDCTLEGLYYWGKLKGIQVIGTGDFTHPAWFMECREKLEPAEGGLFALKKEYAELIDQTLPASVCGNLLRFVPTVEIATIYKKGERVRKLHQLIIMPSLEAVSRLNTQLERIGNLKADGRPILGLDSKELLRLSLEADPDGLYIPAHIWTPWFGLFGSKSGFDAIAEAYEDLAPEIRAIETGLSSDPDMNARLSQLDNIAITSHSDAHSPQKLGREATVVHAAPSYRDVIGGIKANDARLTGTIEFFPEEGKYHADGHRACNVRFTPEETKAHGGICPVCHKSLVVGVNYRVGELADRTPADAPAKKQTEYIVPLAEVIAELHGVKTTSGKAVQAEFHDLITALGDEFSILRTIPLDAIHAVSPHMALAIERIRKREVYRDPGYDGIFGTIKVFKDAAEKAETLNQLSLL
ncbi:MAG TPA: endonuclease Q family protein [Candidatus Saccharimonadales bacterium]|nr:endonuclease Q family protein [Candidatus Saccharimonadales bacterium]